MPLPLHRHALTALPLLALLALLATGGPIGWRTCHAATTDLATAPLETSTATLVKPNLLFVLDDSGSMSWDYLPDWAQASTLCQTINTSSSGNSGSSNGTNGCSSGTGAQLVKNARVNGVAYDPAVTYTPPLTYAGTSYPAMNSANTSAWTKVPADGYGVQSTSTANLATASPTYYTFVAGEYCSSAKLSSCATQSAASTAYPYPAYLRWCTDKSLSTCQANRIETAPTGGSTYLWPRFPGALTSSNTTVPGSVVATTISSSTTSYAYAGGSARASTRTDCSTASSTCSHAEEMTNYANWYAYYRTRLQTMKTATSLAFQDLDSSYRLGYMSLNNNTSSDFLDMADATTTSGGQKSAFYTKLFAARPSSSTPLRTALATAGRYYAGKLSTVNSVAAGDPMQYACQRNYTILSTDGYWNESATPKRIDGSTAIGDQDGSLARPYLDGHATANTLADVAQYYYATDLRASTWSNATNRSTGTDVASNSYSEGQQRMRTSTLGLGASGYMLYDSAYATASSGDYVDVLKGNTASTSAGVCPWQTSGACNWPTPVSDSQTTIDDLWHAAVNGRGTYYSAANPTELQSGLTDFVNTVTAASSNSSAATLSTPSLISGGTHWVFATTFCSAKWYGDLMRYTVDAATGALASTPDWAASGGGGDCTGGSTTATTALLDQQAWATRLIYTWDPDNASSTLIPFAWASLTSTMKGWFQIAAISSLSQLCEAGSGCLSTSAQVDSSTAGTTTGAGGINLVNYLRGQRDNEGSASGKYYAARTHVLGDIVNSTAVYVAAPSFGYTDDGYSAFKTAQASRTAMVYVGANDGMLHAFNAGTGAEAWAYIPSMLLPRLYKLADKKYASHHVNLVDGPLTRADAYFGGAWHTVLVGGLGQGGRGYYALDVTTPASPTVLWEFTHDTSASSAYVRDEDLGYTYGTPVVTQLADGTWVVLLTSGYNNVSPGSGHGVLWVLRLSTGEVIAKLDTGMGSNASGGTVSGCSATPCPAGLARISAWLDSSVHNQAAQVYGGDLYGNVWRFDISALTTAGTGATVQLLATLADAAGSRQPVTTTPELGKVSGQHVVYVGTGAYLGVSDVSSTQTQTMYALKDTLSGSSRTSAIYASPRSNPCSSSKTTACFMKLTASDSASVRTVSATLDTTTNMTTMNGWFTDLPESGERVNTDPTLVNGTLVYVSNVPTASSACATGGSSYLNYVDYATGLAVSGAANAGVLLSATALGSSASAYLTSSGSAKAITTLSDGTRVVSSIPTSTRSSTLRRVSWRELVNGE